MIPESTPIEEALAQLELKLTIPVGVRTYGDLLAVAQRGELDPAVGRVLAPEAYPEETATKASHDKDISNDHEKR